MNRSITRYLAEGLLALLVGSMLVGCDVKNTGESKMKFINVEKVLIDSGLAKQEQDYLKAVNASLQKGQKLAEKSYSNLPADKVEAARVADRNVLEKRWHLQQQAARNVIAVVLKKTTDTYRRDMNIDVIMPMQTALSLSQELDVSADLIAKLKTTKLDFGPVPEITIKANLSGSESVSNSQKTVK